eukprot:4860725-Prymnesium_polylepis.1
MALACVRAAAWACGARTERAPSGRRPDSWRRRPPCRRDQRSGRSTCRAAAPAILGEVCHIRGGVRLIWQRLARALARSAPAI